jgi:hypothetical protein
MIVAGPLTAGIGAREVWVVAGVLLAVAGVIALALTRGVGVGSEAKAAEPAVPS